MSAVLRREAIRPREGPIYRPRQQSSTPQQLLFFCANVTGTNAACESCTVVQVTSAITAAQEATCHLLLSWLSTTCHRKREPGKTLAKNRSNPNHTLPNTKPSQKTRQISSQKSRQTRPTSNLNTRTRTNTPIYGTNTNTKTKNDSNSSTKAHAQTHLRSLAWYTLTRALLST